MNYVDQEITSYNDEYWQKKNYLDNIEVNRRLEVSQNDLRIDHNLRQLYAELWNLQTRWLVPDNIFATFNPELFPDDFMQVVGHIANLAEFESAPVALATLSSVASAMCGRYEVRLDESWAEAGCLFTILCAHPGSRKSAVMGKLGEPHAKHFEMLSTEFEEQSSDFEKSTKNLTLLRRKLTNTIVGNHLKNSCDDGVYFGDPMDLLADLQRTTDMLDQHISTSKPKYKTLPQPFLSTASKVAASESMATQGEFAAIHEAEGGIFENEIAHKSSNPDLYTKSYDMESFHYSSKNAGKIAMRRPAICINTFVQPDVLFKWYNNNNLRSRGLVQRFLVLFADKPMSSRPNRPLPAPPNAGAMITYSTKISEMLKRNYTQDKNRDIRTVSVTSEAYELIKAYEMEMKPYIESIEFLHMGSFLAKAHGAAVRLALCIHAWNNPEPEQSPITQDEMQAAISLMDLIIAHANIAFAPERNQAFVDARTILNWINLCDWTARPVFTDLDARTAISGLNKKQSHAALDLLEQHNYIRQYFEAGKDRICVLHPQLAERNFRQQNTLAGRF